MKREIKFRGKRRNGEWVYGSIVWTEHIEPSIYSELGRCAPYAKQWCYVYPFTVGQFTGILDKDGKEIYEDDIVTLELSDKSLIYKLIRYIPEMGSFCMALTTELQYEGKWTIWHRFDQRYIHDYGGTVVGNIYDNPELLEE